MLDLRKLNACAVRKLSAPAVRRLGVSAKTCNRSVVAVGIFFE